MSSGVETSLDISEVIRDSSTSLGMTRIVWLGILPMTCGNEVVAKDGRESEGDQHNGSRTCDEEASGPTDVLAVSHA
jgi:hypothetical protein